MSLEKDRKTKRKLGAFYTPTYLAEYLAQQAIQKYLIASVNKKFQLNQTDFNELLDNCKEKHFVFLQDELQSLKILDCASGEGEFLVTSFRYLEEIYSLITDNLPFVKNERFNFCQNLFGIELDKDALEDSKKKMMKEFLEKTNKNQSNIINQNIIHGDFLKSMENSWINISELNPGFDIIIGNPPWGSNLSKTERNYYFDKFRIEGNKRNLNSFELFIYKSTLFLKKDKGILGFYLPKNFVRSNQYSNLRKFILENYEIQSLRFYDLFQGVTQEFISIIGMYKSNVNSGHKIAINDSNLISQNEYYTNLDYIFMTKTSDIEMALISSIQEKKVPLSYYVNIKRGEELSKKGGILFCTKCQKWGPFSSRKENIECSNCHTIIPKENLETRNLISKSRTITHSLPILTGDDFSRYKINNCHYFNDSIDFRSKKNKSIYKSPKLVLQKIKSFPCAAYDINQAITTQNVYNITVAMENNNREELLLYLLAILNSSLMYWFYDSQFNLGSKYTNAISIRNLKRLPIPSPEQNKKIFTKIVSNVRSLFDSNDSQSKIILDNINKLIIQLYDCETYTKVIDSIDSEYKKVN